MRFHLVLAVGLLSSSAQAVNTRTFRVTSYKEFEDGEAHGVLLSSRGEASTGFASKRVEISEAVVFSSVTAKDGTVYFGTGDQAAIYEVKKGKAKKLTAIDATMVTSLAIAVDGTLYAGTMPGGRIFSVDKSGAAHELAKLPAEHVWALALDEAHKKLYAGTGPDGKIFSVELASKKDPVHVVYESGEKHILSLAQAEDGSLYAGSSESGILYRIEVGKKISARALHDFEGDEVRAIACHGNTLYVAINEFQKPQTINAQVPHAGIKLNVSAATAAPNALPGRDRKSKSGIVRIDPDNRVEQIHVLSDGYFTALHVDNENNVYAASGSNGRVYMIRPDRTVVTAVDLSERQVLTLALSGDHHLVGTGDAGAAYELTHATAKDANYQSKAFDALFPARFGHLRWTGNGKFVVETRSGNTAHPDKTWSSWETVSHDGKTSEGGVGEVASPDGRYVQVRFNFHSSDAVLRDFSLFYLPQNQRSRITEVTVDERGFSGHIPLQAKVNRTRSPILHLRWKAENFDEDNLVYRLFFRQEGDSSWRLLGGPEPLTTTDVEWNTESLPDGNYVVKVVASDERSNPKELVLEHALESAPFLVDNRKPDVAVKVSYPSLSGHAQDSFSPLSELAYSIDGGDWQLLSPKEGVFDEPSKDFSVKLPSDLSPGTHSLAVRAVDSADNIGAAQTTFKVK